jgi:rSAM/selenodomain-associated transferase 2
MTATPTRISVVVPTLNEREQLPRLLQDLAALRREGLELILVDGGSSDATPAVAAGRVDQVIVTAPGRAAQMNAGARAARGAILWFLHADSRVAPAALAMLDRACADGHRWGRFDVRLSGRRWPFRIIERMMNLRSCVSGLATGDQGIFVTRELFGAVGGYPDQPLMEDIALSKTLRRHGAPCCIRHPRLVTSSRRWEMRGIWRTVWLMWRLRLAYALGAPPHRLARRYR